MLVQITPQESVQSILKFLKGTTQADNGRFVKYDGNNMPW